MMSFPYCNLDGYDRVTFHGGQTGVDSDSSCGWIEVKSLVMHMDPGWANDLEHEDWCLNCLPKFTFNA